jgi:hypothetical protein
MCHQADASSLLYLTLLLLAPEPVRTWNNRILSGHLA